MPKRLHSEEVARRLKASDDWKDFQDKKEALIAGGLSKKEAYFKVYDEYFPGFESQSEDSGIEELPRSAFKPADKRVKAHEIVGWIYDNLHISDVKPEDAPTPGAWWHLQEVRQSAEARRYFLTTVWPKTIVSKSEIDAGDRFKDDGRGLSELIERLAAEGVEGSGKIPDLLIVSEERPGV